MQPRPRSPWRQSEAIGIVRTGRLHNVMYEYVAGLCFLARVFSGVASAGHHVTIKVAHVL